MDSQDSERENRQILSGRTSAKIPEACCLDRSHRIQPSESQVRLSVRMASGNHIALRFRSTREISPGILSASPQHRSSDHPRYLNSVRPGHLAADDILPSAVIPPFQNMTRRFALDHFGAHVRIFGVEHIGHEQSSPGTGTKSLAQVLRRHHDAVEPTSVWVWRGRRRSRTPRSTRGPPWFIEHRAYERPRLRRGSEIPWGAKIVGVLRAGDPLLRPYSI